MLLVVSTGLSKDQRSRIDSGLLPGLHSLANHSRPGSGCFVIYLSQLPLHSDIGHCSVIIFYLDYKAHEGRTHVHVLRGYWMTQGRRLLMSM